MQAPGWSVCGVVVVICAACDGGGTDVPDQDRVAIATVKLASCSAQSPVRFSLLSLPILTSADITCVADAANCAKALGCVGLALAPSCPATPTCVDGDTLLKCVGTIGFVVDCGAWHGNGGASCLTTTSGEAKCGARACTTSTESCDGSTRIDCQSGVETEFDCAALGVTCSMVGTGTGTECATVSAPTCSGSGRCDGNDSVHCESGVELRTSCPAMIDGAACFSTGTDAYCGYGTECTTNLSEPGETCEGTNLNFCLLGRAVTLDCTALGFAGCGSDSLSTRCR